MKRTLQNTLTSKTLFIVMSPHLILHFTDAADIIEYLDMSHTATRITFRHNGLRMEYSAGRAMWATTPTVALKAAATWNERLKRKLFAKLEALKEPARIYTAEEMI